MSRRIPPVRPVTERTTNATCIDLFLPHWVPETIKHLVEERKRARPAGTKGTLFARDIHEDAIRALIQQIEAGEMFMFYAPPVRHVVRKGIWMDASLKAGIERLADSANVSPQAVLWTAFHRYLAAQGVLQDA